MAELIGRKAKDGQGSTRSRSYSVVNATTESAAIGQALTQLTSDLGGTTLDGLALISIAADETEVPNVWQARAEFGIAKGIEQQTQFNTRTGFEFSQETIRVRQSIQTTRYGVRPPNHGNAIGVKHDASGRVTVEGIDVQASSFTFSKTKIYPLSVINTGFLADVGSIDKHWNLAPFAGFAAGEVLFTGLTGNQRSDSEYECAFRFSRRPNDKGLVIGGISVPFKRGWDYLEVLWEEVADDANAAIVPQARAVYVHQVLEGANLGFLGLE